MSARSWRVSDEALEKLPEGISASRAKLPEALKISGGNRAYIELINSLADLVGALESFGLDLRDARMALTNVEAERDRLQARVEKLEGLIGVSKMHAEPIFVPRLREVAEKSEAEKVAVL